MPRPSSRTVTLPSPFRVSSHRVANCLDLVHRVVDDFERHVVQARAVIRVADIHARAAAYGVQPLEHGDRRGIVGARIGIGGIGIGGRVGGIGHAEGLLREWIGYSGY